ncbi:MFS transporter [Desulforhopalus singaporensis]|uniref:MFS transporter, FSR family, fosmidomycin resistance protein n=1 Tax=Desulforhopalus singaporensis TaxID=91360 RepID=A0A1H0K1Q8_9BACT|nr:MFS transporter [Desulforhopalus singaporensis]SDO49611.1 MFS transporter, FSR family, fosmidomycin resistance protein [Desulforhopalus singaporensis]
MTKITRENISGADRFDTPKVLLLSICHFVHDIYSSFLAPLLPFIIEKFGLSLTQAGFMSTVMQLPAFLNPYIGKVADRTSLRYFIILAPVLTAVPMSLLGVAPSYGVILLLLFFAGISVSLFHVPAPVIVYRVAGTRTGRGMSFFMTGGELARTLGPITIVAAVSLFGFEGYYPIMIFGIVSSCVMFLKFKNMPVVIKQKEAPSIRRTCIEMKNLLLPLTGILFVRGFMHACLTAFLPVYIMQKNGDVWLAGIGLSLFETAGVVGILTVGGLSDRFGRKKLLQFCLIVAPLSLLLFSFSQGWLQLLLLLVTGFSLLSTTPVMLAMIQENSREGSSAANGVFMMVSFLARSAVVVVVGFVADKVGLETTYIICGLIGLTGILFVNTLEGTSPVLQQERE